MLVFLLLLFTAHISSSVPVAIPDIQTGDEHTVPMIFGRALPECMSVARYRTTQDIVWSCLATIFACTWVAIHPNIPGPGDSAWTRFKRRLVTMIYALLAPEFTIVWAIRQRIAAGRIMREYSVEIDVPWNRYLSIRYLLEICWIGIRDAVRGCFDDPREGRKWTLTHGFFVQMGGFILYDGATPLQVLRFVDLKDMIAKGDVDAPTISEQQINDRSRGDFLTKLIVVLQTGWFIFQCLARWATNLPVTELEVVTLAFATLNIIAYVLWWKKPQNVLVAVEVQLKPESSSREDLLGGSKGKQESWVIRELRVDIRSGWFGWLFRVPWTLFGAIAHPIDKVINLPQAFETKSLRVPMYHAEASDDKNLTLYPITAIGILFGGLHLIPYSTSFPTMTEEWLWRSSAIYITCLPITAILIDIVDGRPDDYFSRAVIVIIAPLIVSGVALYPLARVTLLVLAFTTLRAQSREAYLNIEWTTFIPHI